MLEARQHVLPRDRRATVSPREPVSSGLCGRCRERRGLGGADMSTLKISGLRASVVGKEILRGIELEVGSGEVHAVMGPNGSGKSTLAHVLAGRPGYEVLGGSVTLDGRELLRSEERRVGKECRSRRSQ